MERPPFDQWAPLEIARLRQQADALQAALDLYTGGNGYAKSDPVGKTAPKGNRARVSKYEPAFQAYEKAGKPLSLDEMMGIAGGLGLQIDRPNMRSQVFAQKHAGRCRPVGENRYAWDLRADSETASS